MLKGARRAAEISLTVECVLCHRPVPYAVLVARYLLDKHPEKTFIVSDP